MSDIAVNEHMAPAPEQKLSVFGTPLPSASTEGPAHTLPSPVAPVVATSGALSVPTLGFPTVPAIPAIPATPVIPTLGAPAMPDSAQAHVLPSLVPSVAPAAIPIVTTGGPAPAVPSLAVPTLAVPTLPEARPAANSAPLEVSDPNAEAAAPGAGPEHPMAHLMPSKSKPNEASRKAAEIRAAQKAKARRTKWAVIAGLLVFTALVGPPTGKWLIDAINEAGNTSTVDEPAD